MLPNSETMEYCPPDVPHRAYDMTNTCMCKNTGVTMYLRSIRFRKSELSTRLWADTIVSAIIAYHIRIRLRIG